VGFVFVFFFLFTIFQLYTKGKTAERKLENKTVRMERKKIGEVSVFPSHLVAKHREKEKRRRKKKA